MADKDSQADARDRTARDTVHSALFSMALVSRINGHRLKSDTLAHRFGHLPNIGPRQLVGAFRDVGIKARLIRIGRFNLHKIPLPAIVVLNDGRYAVLQAVGRDAVQLHRHGSAGATRMPPREFARMSAGRAILVRPGCSPSSPAPAVPGSRFGIGWFLRTLFRYTGVMREALLASAFVQLFALATPIVFMIIIDRVFAHHSLSTLDVLVFALIVIGAFEVLLGGIRSYLLSHTGSRVDVELGRRLFSHLMALPLSYFESRASGDTIARIRELEAVRNVLTGSTLTLLVDLLFVAIFLAVMYLFSPLLAGIVLASLPLFFLVSALVTPVMRHRLEDRHRCAAENQSFLVETLAGIETVKSAAIEPQQQSAFEERLAAYARCASGSASLANWTNQLIALLGKALTIILLYVGAKLVLDGTLTVGQLIAFNMLSGRVVAPVQRLAQIWQELTSVRVSLRRLADIMDAAPETRVRADGTRPQEMVGDVRFERVGFRYDPDRPPVLSEISFEVSAGELVGVLGATGAGKTTLVKLLQRLYTPSSGAIYVDGINLCALDPLWLRRRIGVVAQDFVLFSRSIRDNITLGDPDISDRQVIDAARLAGAHEMISRLPAGYDTMLAERGRGLSAGQRQAIALARALVTNPIILILDEATSAFDYESERNFQERFAAMRAGRTTFVVAHRLSTVRGADRILTLEDGRLVENDTPGRLLEAGGRFGSLHHYDRVAPAGGLIHVAP